MPKGPLQRTQPWLGIFTNLIKYEMTGMSVCRWSQWVRWSGLRWYLLLCVSFKLNADWIFVLLEWKWTEKHFMHQHGIVPEKKQKLACPPGCSYHFRLEPKLINRDYFTVIWPGNAYCTVSHGRQKPDVSGGFCPVWEGKWSSAIDIPSAHMQEQHVYTPFWIIWGPTTWCLIFIRHLEMSALKHCTVS